MCCPICGYEEETPFLLKMANGSIGLNHRCGHIEMLDHLPIHELVKISGYIRAQGGK